MLQRRRKTQRPLSIAGLAGLTALALVAAAAPTAVADEPEFTGTVSIVHINDVHSNVFESATNIGYAKVAGYADQVKAENPNTLFLDAGDWLAGSPYSAFDQGASLVPVMNTLGLDATTVGNAEFTYGSSVLKERMSALNYPSLGGNMVYKDGGESIAPTTTKLTLDNGMTVGLVGVTTPLSAAMGATDLEYVDAIEVAQQGVDQLKAEGVDLLIGLVHLGELDKDMTSVKLAEAITDFDVIIDGHSHTPFPDGLMANGTLIAQAGGFSDYVGRVDLTVTDGEVTGVAAQLRNKAQVADVTPKATTQAALSELQSKADAYFATVIGSTSVHLDGNRTKVRTGEAEVANMFTDAVREASGADVALLGAGFIGGNIQPGPITRQQLLEIARVDTSVLLKRMTGAQLQAYLKRATQEYPAESGTFPHISGGSYRIDTAAEQRIHSVTVGGEALDADREYLVAIPAGGGEFPGAIDAPTIEDLGSATPMLEEYLAAHSPVAPQLECRFGQAPWTAEPASGIGCPTTTTVKFAKSSTKYNGANSATVTVTSDYGTPTGKATLRIAGKNYTAKLVDGKAKIALSKPVKVGTHEATAEYTHAGDGTLLASSSATVTVKVTKATPKVSAKLRASKVSSKKQATVKVAVTIPGSLKAKASQFKVRVFDGSKRLKTVTVNKAGKANIKLPKLKKGTHKIRVEAVATANTTSNSSVVRRLTVTG
ncbi:MAG: 5'-nucleotidase C-terminal domain-containing protein [Leucobacter sp.]